MSRILDYLVLCLLVILTTVTGVFTYLTVRHTLTSHEPMSALYAITIFISTLLYSLYSAFSFWKSRAELRKLLEKRGNKNDQIKPRSTR